MESEVRDDLLVVGRLSEQCVEGRLRHPGRLFFVGGGVPSGDDHERASPKDEGEVYPVVAEVRPAD